MLSHVVVPLPFVLLDLVFNANRTLTVPAAPHTVSLEHVFSVTPILNVDHPPTVTHCATEINAHSKEVQQCAQEVLQCVTLHQAFVSNV